MCSFEKPSVKSRSKDIKFSEDFARISAFRSATRMASPAERVAVGKALRDKIRRKQHGVWKADKARSNPIDLLRKLDIGRMKKLVPIRYGRMLQSPFAFYRGAAGVIASDLARTPTTELKVQACGDCHLMNFGGFATPERNVIFDINDFDETSPAPWEWDVPRGARFDLVSEVPIEQAHAHATLVPLAADNGIPAEYRARWRYRPGHRHGPGQAAGRGQ
jgi:hypothetical protein